MSIKWLDRRIAKPAPYMTLCLTQQEFDAVCKKLGAASFDFINSGADATTHFFTHSDGGNCAVICIDAKPDNDPIQIAAMLVHEAVHIWQDYIRTMGEKFPGDEQEAYGIQSLSQELMTEYASRITK